MAPSRLSAIYVELEQPLTPDHLVRLNTLITSALVSDEIDHRKGQALASLYRQRVMLSKSADGEAMDPGMDEQALIDAALPSIPLDKLEAELKRRKRASTASR